MILDNTITAGVSQTTSDLRCMSYVNNVAYEIANFMLETPSPFILIATHQDAMCMSK